MNNVILYLLFLAIWAALGWCFRGHKIGDEQR